MKLVPSRRRLVQRTGISLGGRLTSVSMRLVFLRGRRLRLLLFLQCISFCIAPAPLRASSIEETGPVRNFLCYFAYLLINDSRRRAPILPQCLRCGDRAGLSTWPTGIGNCQLVCIRPLTVCVNLCGLSRVDRTPQRTPTARAIPAEGGGRAQRLLSPANVFRSRYAGCRANSIN